MLTLVLLGAPELADVPEEPEPPRYWYGWQNFAIAGAGIAVAAGGSVLRSETESDVFIFPILIGLAAAFSGSAFVHLRHKNSFEALGALLLQTGFIVGGAIGGVFLARSYETSLGQGALWGAMGGSLLALSIDAPTFAWEPVVVATDGGAAVALSMPLAF